MKVTGKGNTVKIWTLNDALDKGTYSPPPSISHLHDIECGCLSSLGFLESTRKLEKLRGEEIVLFALMQFIATNLAS